MSSVTGLGNFLEIFKAARHTATTWSGGVDLVAYTGGLEIYQSATAVSGGSPTLDGKMQDCTDSVGMGLAGASFDFTGNGEGELHLSEAGAFATYTYRSGDVIALSGAAGVPDGVYSVASRVDDDAILLTADARLTADTTSDATSPAWADISGEAFTGLTTSDGGEAITINANSCKRYIRWVGTSGGSTPIYDVSVIAFGQGKTSAPST